MENSLIDEQRIIKQSFLREEILESGFDTYSFQLFMENQKEEGSNIDNWTLVELQKAVADFKKKSHDHGFEKITSEEVVVREKKPTINEPAPKHQDNEIEELTNENEEEKVLDSSQFSQQYKEPNKKEEEVFSHEVLIQKQRPFHEGTLPNSVEISRIEEQKGGFFGLGRSHIVYVIQCLPTNWEVKRRFRDFTWLRETLAKLYPGFLVPVMTKKKAGKGKVEYYNAKKKAYLNAFLKNLLKTPEFVSNEYMISFLRMTDEKKFKLKKKEADALKPLTRLKDHINIEGKAELKISPEHKHFSHHISEFIDGNADIYANLKKKSKKLLLDIDQVSTSLFDIAKDFEILFQTTNETSSKLTNPTCLDGLKDVYVSLNNMLAAMGNSLVKQANLLQENMLYFLNYQSKQVFGFQELIKKRQCSYQEYMKFRLKLEAKKDKLWATSDPTKWELSTTLKLKPHDLLQNKIEAYKQMCSKENQAENELKELFSYYNSQLFKEVSKGLDLKAYNYRKMIDCLTNENQNILEEMIKEWRSTYEFCNKDMSQKPLLFKGSSIMVERKSKNDKLPRESQGEIDKKADSESD